LPDRWTHGAGCNLCSETGYSGRVGVYELLQVTDRIRDLIVTKATAREIREVAIEEGMRTMLAQACELVADGVTTVDDVMRNVYAPGMDVTEDEMLDEESGVIPLSGRSSADADMEASA
jgi:type IV pilus assembly protein PilB